MNKLDLSSQGPTPKLCPNVLPGIADPRPVFRQLTRVRLQDELLQHGSPFQK